MDMSEKVAVVRLWAGYRGVCGYVVHGSMSMRIAHLISQKIVRRVNLSVVYKADETLPLACALALNAGANLAHGLTIGMSGIEFIVRRAGFLRVCKQS